MARFHLHLLSDSTGETLEMIAKAALAQFDDRDVLRHFWPMVRSQQHLDRIMGEIAANPGLVFFTLVNEETRRDFLIRSELVAAIRRFLDARGFVEVETPILQPRYGGALAEPFVTHSNELDADLYLRIADELYLKRLIVGGLEKVYEISKDFRNESISYKHQPEFTMLEWYEAYADYRDTMARMEALVETVARETTGTTGAVFRGHEVDLAAPWRRVKLVDALTEHGLWTRDEVELRRLLDERGVDTKADHTWAQLVDHALSSFVEATRARGHALASWSDLPAPV